MCGFGVVLSVGPASTGTGGLPVGIEDEAAGGGAVEAAAAPYMCCPRLLRLRPGRSSTVLPPSARGTGASRTFENSPRATLRRLVHQLTTQYSSCAGRLAASMPRLAPIYHAYVRTTR